MRAKHPVRKEERRGGESPNPAPEPLPNEVLDKLPERVRVAAVEAASFSGPLPPPTMYGEYERVLPGSAERILAMAEKEQNHRIGWETMELDTSVGETKLGQWLGFAIAILCIGAAVFLAMSGHSAIAGIALAASAVGIVGRFLKK